MVYHDVNAETCSHFCQSFMDIQMRLLEGTPFDRPPHCPRCDRLETKCQCPPDPVGSNLLSPKQQTAKLTVERRKKGKTVTVIRGLAAANNDLPSLLTKLKDSCGAGGTIEGDELEIQGDQRDKLLKKLGQIGYRVQ